MHRAGYGVYALAIEMKFFTKKELLAVISILILILLASFTNLKDSLRRARDLQRKNDISELTDILARYGGDFGAFPLSDSQGRIVACKGPDTKVDAKGRITGLISCDWGKDPLVDVSDPTYPPYKDRLPLDPDETEGVKYYYLSNGKRFQLFAALEGVDEAEYDEKILARNLSCGTRICNFGLAYGATPLDKSIEEYENELLGK